MKFVTGNKLLFILLLSIALTGCINKTSNTPSYQPTHNGKESLVDNSKQGFDYKIECAKSLSEAKKDFEEIKKNALDGQFYEIFYSPILDTCIAHFHIQDTVFEDYYYSYYFKDALSGKIIRVVDQLDWNPDETTNPFISATEASKGFAKYLKGEIKKEELDAKILKNL